MVGNVLYSTSNFICPAKDGASLPCPPTNQVLHKHVTLLRSPFPGGAHPTSSLSSLKMLRRLEGTGTPGATEKDIPMACPGPW